MRGERSPPKPTPSSPVVVARCKYCASRNRLLCQELACAGDPLIKPYTDKCEHRSHSCSICLVTTLESGEEITYNPLRMKK
jgi:hypothetical protein